MRTSRTVSWSFSAVVCTFAGAAGAQWDPTAGHWGKTDAADVRVMTFNVKDAICSSNAKSTAGNNWAACARIVAALQPDVLLLQECADNNGNGTGTSVDSVSALLTTVGMFLHGGLDTFHTGSPAITAYVQAYAPGYDLPYQFVSAITDGFNRNVILSRYPFADRNGDGRAVLSDIPTITADLYAPGGTGGIRGFMTAEIDLPDAVYAGDIVIGNAHLKAGGTASDHAERVTAARNIAYYIDYFWNGAGGTVPDPRNTIADNPPATAVLGPSTPFLLGGDWNEDEYTNGTIGPAAWIAGAQVGDPNGTDGPDRNRTDMTYDASTDVFTAGMGTYPSLGVKDDYLCWQDSMFALRRSFVFDTANVTPAAAMPTQINGFTPSASRASGAASDHRPVIGDYILPGPVGCNTAAVDMGFAKLGGNQRFPRFGACGSLAGGSSAALTLTSCPPRALAFAGLSGTPGPMLAFGATIVLDQPLVIGPWMTDPNGNLLVPVPGGGAVPLYMQWVMLDAGATFGLGFSNALRLLFHP
jgi:endonuclease/exonuclease/phosphatase family metal-dependent hydrolase